MTVYVPCDGPASRRRFRKILQHVAVRVLYAAAVAAAVYVGVMYT